MGVSSSCNLVSLSSNPHLLRLASTEGIPLLDSFWETLLEFSLQPPDNSADSRLLEESVDQICANFAKNNLQSGNLSTLLSIVISLIKHVLGETADQQVSTEDLDTLYNALLIVRTLSKYIIQNTALDVSPQHFVTPEIVAMENNGSESPPTIALKHVTRYETSVDELCYYLYEFLINNVIRSPTIPVHSECIKILTILASAQLYHETVPTASHYLSDMMTGRCSRSAAQLISKLILNTIREPTPAPVGWGTYMWSYIPYMGAGETGDRDEEFSTECLLFTLLIVNHCTQLDNPYRRALTTFGHKEPSSNVDDTCFVMDLDKLYAHYCKGQTSEQETLLLYTLLQGNDNVKTFILSRTDIEHMLLPMLQVLYEAEAHSTHHMYMILIILLILTHDDSFSSYIHDLVVPTVTWYKERILTNISVGGLLILVILKTIQANITKMRDKYLHTNCLATLANMSSKFHSFHPYVAEKILNLFSTIVKKYSKIRNALLGVGPETVNIESSQEYMESELETLEDILRMFLEIFNSSICYSGKNNPVLLYELLHKREVFTPFQTHPAFSELIVNTESILGYLTLKLEERMEETGGSVSVAGVMEVIEEVIRQWPTDRLQPTPVLKFEYVEESQPEEFFLPYIWTLLFSNSNLYWDTSRITLKV